MHLYHVLLTGLYKSAYDIAGDEENASSLDVVRIPAAIIKIYQAMWFDL